MDCSITVVGDGVVGKTCLLFRYVQGKVPDDIEYVPTVFELYSEVVNVNGVDVNLQLWDTAGQEDYEKLRVLAYNKCDAFLLCYDITNPDSLEHCKTKWAKELRNYNKCPIILVGTKLDLAKDTELIGQRGKKVAKSIKAADHFLTSSKTGIGVRECFEKAIELKLKGKPKLCKMCCILL